MKKNDTVIDSYCCQSKSNPDLFSLCQKGIPKLMKSVK